MYNPMRRWSNKSYVKFPVFFDLVWREFARVTTKRLFQDRITAWRGEMAKPTTKIKSVAIAVYRGNAKLGTVSVERQYISWKPASKVKWRSKTWNEFHAWMTNSGS
jgi:hypothetical protein